MPFIPDLNDPQWDWTIPKKCAGEQLAEITRIAVAAPTTATKQRTQPRHAASTWKTELSSAPRATPSSPPKDQQTQHSRRPRAQSSRSTRVRDGFVSLTRPNFTPIASAEPVQLNVGARGISVEPNAPPIFDDNNLPAMPHWLIGLLGGLLAFGFVIAIALWLVQFPPKKRGKKQRRNAFSAGDMRGLASVFGGRRRIGYDHLSGHDEEGDYRPPVPPQDDGTATGSNAGAKARQRKLLSIDTSQTYAGLGIAVPGSSNRASDARSSTLLAPPRPRRRSYDEEKLTHRAQPPLSPARWAWEALTAPIPSIAVFSASVTAAPMSALETRYTHDGFNEETALENGTYTPPEMAVESQDSRTPSPYAERGERSMAERASGFFEKVGDGIEAAAEKLGKMLSEQVNRGEQEEGLLLPVRDGEREVATW